MRKIAAIDIGSNAIRLLIKEDDSQTYYNPQVRPDKDFFIRNAIRLGNDVYATGLISPEKEELLTQALRQFSFIMNAHRVAEYRACATAAFRDAKNGPDVAKRLLDTTGIHVEIISGEEEAKLVRRSYEAQVPSSQQTVLFADVGGGSTDTSLCRAGQLLFTRSYRVGSMRKTEGKMPEESIVEMELELSKLCNRFAPIRLVGSGGSIHLFCKLLATPEHPECVTAAQLERFYNNLKELTIEERMAQYQMKRDRAEIVVEAAEIFLRIARAVGADLLYAPLIGVRDGIIVQLQQK